MQAQKKNIEKIGRLKKRSDFLSVAKAEHKWVSDSLVLQLLPKTNDDQTNRSLRYGITATKKIGGAPQRNRVKRRLRAAVKDILSCELNDGTKSDIKSNMEAFRAQKSWDIVLIGRGKTADVPYDKLKGDLKWCLKRLANKISEDTQ